MSGYRSKVRVSRQVPLCATIRKPLAGIAPVIMMNIG